LASHLKIRLSAFSEIKHESHLITIRILNRVSLKRREKARYLRSLSQVDLHFGCGRNCLYGGINIDAYPVDGIDYVTDLRFGLPLADNSARYVFSEHVFEHFNRADIGSILSEILRVLKDGGTVRIIVPDLAFYCEKYTRGEVAQITIPVPGTFTCAEAVNDVFNSHFHRFIYDFQTLKDEISDAGFVNIVKTRYGSSEHVGLAVDSQFPSRSTGSLCVEATKPTR
jgi:predicted SAM-dependent methyltransferase